MEQTAPKPQLGNMHLKLTIGELIKIINAKLIKGNSNISFDSFETDTRKLSQGAFFWAFKGNTFDGHDFLNETLLKKTKGWIVEEKKIQNIKNFPEVVIAVDDTLKALHRLATYHRSRFNIPIACVTGSNGKSTTKEMLKSIFSVKGLTCSNAGNFNNQFGLPLSVLELNDEHKFAVFELGASRKGDILEIGIIAKPNIAVITNVSPAHLEFFGDMETIYSTKTEIIGCLKENGIFVYNLDDEFLFRLRNNPAMKISFGYNEESDIRIIDVQRGVEFIHKNKKIKIALPARAKHDILNAAASAAAALACQIKWEDIVRGLENFKPLPMRMQEIKLNNSIVIFDAYNANPVSMKSAVSHVTNSNYPEPHYLVLGDMKELGKYCRQYHGELGEFISNLEIERIFLAGSDTLETLNTVLKLNPSQKITHSEDLEWMPLLIDLILKNSGTFLIKASRAMKFEKIIEELKKRCGAEAPWRL